MPRGQSAEHMREIGKNTRFCGKNTAGAGLSAEENQVKSTEAKRKNASFKQYINENLTDADFSGAFGALKGQCNEGNVAALKLLFDFTATPEEKREDNEVKIIVAESDVDEFSD